MRGRKGDVILVGAAAAAMGCAGVSAAAGQVVRAQVIAKVGQTDLPGGMGKAVQTMGTPFTNALGEVGFLGSFTDSERFVYFRDGIVFLSFSDPILDGGESTMGISDAGDWVYSPVTIGHDTLYTPLGVYVRQDDEPLGLPGQFVTILTRPTMQPDGTIWWVGGWSATHEGSTEGRMFCRSVDVAAGTYAVEFQSGDVVGGGGGGGLTLAFDGSNNGISAEYDVSDNNAHAINELFASGVGTGTDNFVLVDGEIVAREGFAAPNTGVTENFSVFDASSINSRGEWMLSGDTDAATTQDEFLSYMGQAYLREGQTTDEGVTITSPADVRAVSINNRGWCAHVWNFGGAERLMYGPATNPAASRVLLSVNDGLDLDGDGDSDGVVTDFNATTTITPGLDLADDGFLFLDLDVDFVQTIVRVRLFCRQDFNLDFSVDAFDYDDFVSAYFSYVQSGTGFPDYNLDGYVDAFDYDDFVSDFFAGCV